jgi:hypothetical protein
VERARKQNPIAQSVLYRGHIVQKILLFITNRPLSHTLALRLSTLDDLNARTFHPSLSDSPLIHAAPPSQLREYNVPVTTRLDILHRVSRRSFLAYFLDILAFL